MWHLGLSATRLGNLLVPPNSTYPYCQFWSTTATGISGGLSPDEFPLGGANVGMGDGSVRFLKSSVNGEPLGARLDRAG